jgi:hypothetical protein
MGSQLARDKVGLSVHNESPILRCFTPALVAFQQQILTPHSKLPLAITDPSVLIIQHYLDVSPTCDEILKAWQDGTRVCDRCVSPWCSLTI